MPTKGRIQVAPGQVIASAQWGNPLWDQSVQAFASAADRTTQFPAPQTGATTWLDDVKRVETWDGTAWVESLYNRPYANGTPVQSPAPGGFTGWGMTNAVPDNTGTMVFNTDRYNLTRAGLYLINFYMSGAVANFSAMIRLYSSGGANIAGSVAGSSDGQATVTLVRNMAPGDVVGPYLWFPPGGATVGGGATTFNITYLGPKHA